MADAALTAYPQQPSIELCQQACQERLACQYFVWYDYLQGGSQCFLRDKVEYSVPNVTDTSMSYALFEVRRPQW